MSRLSQMQARFQQKQMQEKEEKLLRLYENQQQRAIDRVNRDSAGSNTSTKSITQGRGKVRQMFDERRQKAGIDRSYPLEPIKYGKVRANSLDRNDANAKTVIKSTVKSNISHVQNGKPLINKREIVQSLYNNNNGDEDYEEVIYHNENNLRNGYSLNKTYKQKDLENIINNFHVTIDDEEFPDVNIDAFEESPIKQRISNIGTKLYTHNKNELKSTDQKTYNKNGIHQQKVYSPVKNNAKPLVKRTVTRTPNSPSQNSYTVLNSRSPTNSSGGIKSEKLSSSMSSTSKNAKKNVEQQKSPSTARPASNKQTGRGPPSAVNRDDLAGCRYCNRRFAPDRLAVHEDICSKTAQKKRKIYDATKHRVQGTDLEPYARKGNRSKPASDQQGAGIFHSKQQLPKKGGNKQAPVAKKADWRKKHEEFIGAIRAAKAAQQHVAAGGKLSDLPPPPPSSNPDYVQCPHCGRRFNQTAADRHIPKCASYDFNKTKPSQGAPNKIR